MTNAKLIKALRNCIGMYPDGSCDKCPYDKHPRCSIDMMRDAADALEAAEKRIAELEAQIPKEGEWIKHGCEEEQFEYYECPLCGFIGLNYHYCPNCGAKMDGERKDGAE